MTAEHNNNVTILIAEDDEGHAELILEQLRSAGVSNEIIRFRDGQELWNYLMAEGRRTSRHDSHGFLLLLDLVMPRLDGLEVLRQIRLDPRTCRLPVVILTTSKEEQDVAQSYDLGANSYIRKPVDFHQFTEAVRNLGLYWLLLNEPPPMM